MCYIAGAPAAIPPLVRRFDELMEQENIYHGINEPVFVKLNVDVTLRV